MTIAALLLAALLTGGCAGLGGLAIAVEVVGGAIGVYQRFEDRQAQIDQTAEIKKLREEIARRNATPPPAYFCLHGGSPHGPATLCHPAATAE